MPRGGERPAPADGPAGARPASWASRADPSVAHLVGRLDAVKAVVRAEVLRRRRDEVGPRDPFRGLYLSEEHLDRVLARHPEPVDRGPAEELVARAEAEADRAEAGGATLRLRRLGVTFGLDDLDVDLLLVAMAPDVDSGLEQLVGYLHDDVTRWRPSAGLALALCGRSPLDAAARAHLRPGGPLLDGGLVVVEEGERPFLTRRLHVPDRVTMHLLGDDRPDEALAACLATAPPCLSGDPATLAGAIKRGAGLVYLRESRGTSGTALAAAAFADLGLPVVVLDLTRLSPASDPAVVVAAAVREARLAGGGLVAGPVERLIERGADAVRTFAETAWPVIMTGRGHWDPVWARTVPLLMEVPALQACSRAAAWRAALGDDVGDDVDVGTATASFRLDSGQIARAATSAWLSALRDDRPVTVDDLRAGARAQNSAALERLARRIEPGFGWDDLVLPASTLELLHELVARVRLRARVLDDWAMRRGGRLGEGVTALFAGPSGTGKTMAAEVLARDLGLDLYTIDLAMVVDKYIGETEKNLDRIFTEAEGVNGILFFDEADALFGKRSDVKDAHDRYANIETAYLLQRMEAFDGVAILATNLRANLDDAFARRLDALIDFPLPDADRRLRLWESCLPSTVPRAGDVDLGFCARSFSISGGNIRNITLAAAYFAAEEDRPVAMADLIRAVEREYRKLGRLVVEIEFGPYFELVSPRLSDG